MTFSFHSFLTFPFGKFTKLQPVLAWNNSEMFSSTFLGKGCSLGRPDPGRQRLPAETDSANRLPAVSVQSKKGSLLGQVQFASTAAYQRWE